MGRSPGINDPDRCRAIPRRLFKKHAKIRWKVRHQRVQLKRPIGSRLILSAADQSASAPSRALEDRVRRA
jgi:hypothetical protein